MRTCADAQIGQLKLAQIEAQPDVELSLVVSISGLLLVGIPRKQFTKNERPSVTGDGMRIFVCLL